VVTRKIRFASPMFSLSEIIREQNGWTIFSTHYAGHRSDIICDEDASK
jgi:hypothetical protein